MLLDPYQFTALEILHITRESPEAVSVQVRRPDDYHFLPGQHAVIRVSVNGTKLTRQYSFSSAPSSNEIWLTIVKTPGGAVSNWFIETAKVGDTVEVSKPFTGPLVQKITRGKICMIAGGSGIAPLMSHLRQIRLHDQPPNINLLYSTRSTRRCFEDELEPRPNETIATHLSDQQGHITEAMVTTALNECSTLYLCGSRAFVQDVRTMCEKISPDTIVFSESFTL